MLSKETIAEMQYAMAQPWIVHADNYCHYVRQLLEERRAREEAAVVALHAMQAALQRIKDERGMTSAYKEVAALQQAIARLTDELPPQPGRCDDCGQPAVFLLKAKHYCFPCCSKKVY